MAASAGLVEVIPTPMRQASFTVTNGASSGKPGLVHISVQKFTDTCWIFLTEDTNCSPGVVLTYTATELGPSAFMFEGEIPSVECVVLLGLRDHPLTNLAASTIAHTLRQAGESRMLMMAISVLKTANLLTNLASRKAFLDTVKMHVLEMIAA